MEKGKGINCSNTYRKGKRRRQGWNEHQKQIKEAEKKVRERRERGGKIGKRKGINCSSTGRKGGKRRLGWNGCQKQKEREQKRK